MQKKCPASECHADRPQDDPCGIAASIDGFDDLLALVTTLLSVSAAAIVLGMGAERSVVASRGFEEAEVLRHPESHGRHRVLPLVSSRGNVLGALHVRERKSQSVSERKRAKALTAAARLVAAHVEFRSVRTDVEQERYETLRSLFDLNPIPMWIFDAHSLEFVFVNEASCGLYGYSKEELLGLNSLEVRPPENRDTVRDVIMSFGEVYQPDQAGVHVTATGERIRVLTFARRIRFEGRDCVLVANIDVTAREQAAAELRSTQIFLDAIVESIPSMVFVKDARDGRFVLLNKAGEALLGVERQELIGKTDFDLFEPDDAERFREADQAVVALGELVTIENEPLNSPGGLRSLRTQKVGVPDFEGKPRYLLGISEDVTEKLAVEERSRHLSLHDILTDLPNRLSFNNTLAEMLTGGDDFALLLLDLDRFKAVNDSFGHHAGDELLRQVSARMLASGGAQDIIARLGGDEFGVLHRGAIGEDSAARLAIAFIQALAEPFVIDGNLVSIGCSAGIVLRSRHGSNADALMKRADLALYAAKTAGKGDFAWFEPGMEDKADKERLLRMELATAIDRRELFVEYQPIVSAETGRIVCCEALVRWRHPRRGLISPGDFIPVAEASGLIEPIGRWVLQEACREAKQWPADVRVAVNLSPRQFAGFGLVADVTKALDQTGLSPSRLELEITETIFLTDSQENIRLLKQLKALGVRIALDDFGTGYSSLAYLRSFSFDKLKIDRSFVTDLTTSQENLAIVRAVIGLGKSFSATVTAEGVEDDEQFACLAVEGCDQMQGFLLGRPVAAERIAEMFSSFRYRRVG